MFLSLFTCRETLARLDDYLDRELSETEIRRVQTHLRICHRCAKRFRFEAALLAEMRHKIARLESESTPEDLMEKIRVALFEK
jgi:predicted anti-sigma-YlaC factor YlaD